VSLKPIRNVIFDFGGVLVEWRPQQIIELFYADEALRALAQTEIFQHPDWLELDLGTLEEAAAVQRFSERTGRPLAEMTALFEHVRQSLRPIPHSVEVLRELSRAAIPLYGLSNMPAATFEFLRARDEHWSVFRGIVISGAVKMMKPDARIFEHIAQLHGLTPAETLFIDDSPPNIETARRLGFHTLLFRDPIQSGAEIKRLLNL
jgi:putative hydrolase of the HAD superfamily